MPENFIKISTEFLKRTTESYVQQVYIYLKRHVNIAGFASRSYREIADGVGISISEAKKVIKNMCSRHIIRKELITSASGGNEPNHYVLVDSDAFWKSDITDKIKYLSNMSSSDNVCSGFVKIPYSFLSADLKPHAKTIYICIKRFFNRDKNIAFPSLKKIAECTGLCVKTVIKYIKLLEEQKLIKKYSYYSTRTAKKCSNRYTVYNVFPQKKTNNLSQINDKELYKKSEKDVLPESAPDTWAIEQIKEYYAYDDYLVPEAKRHRINIDVVDSILRIICNNMNNNRNRIIAGRSLPSAIIHSALYKLTPESVIDVAERYVNNTTKVHNPDGYILQMLMRADYQSTLNLINDVSHDMFDNQ